MLCRAGEIRRVRALLRESPVVALLGPRQAGKTTLARQVSDGFGMEVHRYDLENPVDVARLSDPMLSLGRLRGLVILDEVQRRPELFPALRVLADRPRRPCRFLVLGSASPALLRQSSETLAGRIAHHVLGGFSMEEVGAARLGTLWLRGGFPRSFLARTDRESLRWRRDFIRTFLERDLPQMGITIPSSTMGRFWNMLAHAHGQIWNSSGFASSFGTADTTVRRYVDLLTSLFMVRQLPPWHENLGKRQVKSPKIFLSDPGLLHALLDLPARRDLEGHPKLGASWEGFGVEQVVRRMGARPEECFFWATHAGAELDLLVVRGRRRRGFEFKHASAPGVTPSMRIALHDLKLDRLEVIHAGEHTYPLAPKIRAVALRNLMRDVVPLA